MDQTQPVDFTHHRESGRAGKRIARIGEPMDEAAIVDDRIGDAAVGHHGAERHIAGAETLGKRDQIRAQAPMVGGEVFSGASGAAHHLVGDQQNAELVADPADLGVITVGRDQRACRSAAYRLHDKCQHRFRALAKNFIAQVARIFQAALVIVEIVAIEIAGRRGDLGHLPHHRRERCAHERHAGDAEGAQGSIRDRTGNREMIFHRDASPIAIAYWRASLRQLSTASEPPETKKTRSRPVGIRSDI